MNTVDGQTLLTICISALIFFSLGILSGWLVSLLRGASSQAQKTPPTISDAEQGLPTPPLKTIETNKIELARIYQGCDDGQVTLERGGIPFSTPADVHAAERTWLVLTAEAIYHLLGQDSSRAAPAGPVQPPAAERPVLRWQPEPIQQMQKPSMNPAEVLIRAVQAGQPKLNQSKSLVEQIDEILQEMLEQSPLQAGEIHLSENADLALEVQVSSQRYDGIEAVPDESVRQAIRAAIAEWQRRNQRR